MSNAQINQRLSELERQIVELKAQVNGRGNANGWRAVAGSFANDPLFEQAMRFGAAYRDSLRPKSANRRKKSR